MPALEGYPPGQEPGGPEDPLASMEAASPEEEAYLGEVTDKIDEKFFAQGLTESVVRQLKANPTAKGVAGAAMPFLDMAKEQMLQMDADPPEDIGWLTAAHVVDRVVDIGVEMNVLDLSDEMINESLQMVGKRFVEAHPELYSGGASNGRTEPQRGGNGLLSGGAGGPQAGPGRQA